MEMEMKARKDVAQLAAGHQEELLDEETRQLVDSQPPVPDPSSEGLNEP